jgi:hypothetical protein
MMPARELVPKRFWWVAFALCIAPSTAFGQLRTELIRGTVTTDSGIVVAGASVTATRAPDRQIFRTTSDVTGRYVLVIAEGSGDYLLHVAAPGRQAFRRRITRPPGPTSDSTYVVDVRLASLVQQLAAVRVEAKKPKPSRQRDPGIETGASEFLPDAFLGQLPPGLVGDLAATALTLPNTVALGSGFSVLGLGPEQNSFTLGGMSFPGSAIPRDAPVQVRVATSTYDPARGWFSGGNVNVDATPGGLYSSLRWHATVDAPALQYADPVSVQLGQRFTNVDLSIGGGGPLTETDRYFYSFGAQGGRRIGEIASITNADPALLRRAGVVSDSVSRFLTILDAAGIPIGEGDTRTSVVTDRASMLVRLDRAPYDWNSLSPSRTTQALTLFGSWTRSEPVALLPTGTPNHGAHDETGALQVQGLYSHYFSNDYLAEARTSVSGFLRRSRPLLGIPEGSVPVASIFPDGSAGLTTLTFGGNDARQHDSRGTSWETIAEMQLYPRWRTAHRVKITADARLDDSRENSAPDALGRFTFGSLADLSANAATSFSRTVFAPPRRGREWNAFVAIGDLWKVTPTFQLLYGARIEGNYSIDVPAYNFVVDTAFGVRTDAMPDRWHVSPRLGFTWVRGGAANNGAIAFNPMGRFSLGPTSYIRGGIGEFRNILSADLLSDARATTGLPGGVETLRCVGSATPVPDWAGYAGGAALPTACNSGPFTAPQADDAPRIALFDRSYAPSRSWRANLSYASQLARLTYSIEGIYSLNLDQRQLMDLNVPTSARFYAAGEHRPVFVPVTTIVPTTGMISMAGARRNASFGPVILNRSDGRSLSRQLLVTVAPELSGVSRWFLSGAYTLSDTRALSNGFSSTTFDDPAARQWARSPFDVRHSFLLRAGIASEQLTFTLFGRFQSGIPFTPLVNMDINGDGLANDRAFVTAPGATSDTILASAMRSLLVTGNSRVAECLGRQLGRAAGENSCEGPWTAMINAQVTAAGRALHLPSRVTSVVVSLTNPLAGLDALVHGQGGLHGWGAQPAPDPVLYEVRGFDPATPAFKYAVNPRFGSTDPSRMLVRSGFLATVELSVNLGRDIALQQLERSLKAGRRGLPGPRLGAADLKRRYERGVPDPYAPLLIESDSLLLSRAQVEALQAAQLRLRTKLDTVWLELGTYLTGLGDEYDTKEAIVRQEAAIAQAWELSRLDVREQLPQILSPIQLRLLPGIASVLLRAAEVYKPGGRTLSP